MDLLQKKRDLLKKKFGLFKALVYILQQQQLFTKTMTSILRDTGSMIKKKDRIFSIQKSFDYLCTTLDI